jgi:hypothetical protein
MCPECSATAFMVIAGLFLTPWRALLSAFVTLRSFKHVH